MTIHDESQVATALRTEAGIELPLRELRAKGVLSGLVLQLRAADLPH